MKKRIEYKLDVALLESDEKNQLYDELEKLNYRHEKYMEENNIDIFDPENIDMDIFYLLYYEY
jgi:hypothetical protein